MKDKLAKRIEKKRKEKVEAPQSKPTPIEKFKAKATREQLMIYAQKQKVNKFYERLEIFMQFTSSSKS